jgi:hypothetical protein
MLPPTQQASNQIIWSDLRQNNSWYPVANQAGFSQAVSGDLPAETPSHALSVFLDGKEEMMVPAAAAAAISGHVRFVEVSLLLLLEGN